MNGLGTTSYSFRAVSRPIEVLGYHVCSIYAAWLTFSLKVINHFGRGK